jgi:hypothetical protein
MRTAPALGDDDGIELVELLVFVTDFCRAEHDVVSAALSRFVGIGYDAGDLSDDAARLAGVVAGTIGLDASMERAR